MSAGSPSLCRLCGRAITTPALSFGRLPVCNRFTTTEAVDTLVDLDVVECESCQLVQLRVTPPVDALVPQLPWIRYREPEGHLDSLVEAVLALRPNARTALGTGPFDGPLLSRLAIRGLATTALELDTPGAQGRSPYLESWQASLNAPRLSHMAARRGTFDVVSSRCILEHSPQPVAALTALKSLLAEGALLLIEVPDSSKFLAARDYCFLWEEHSCYFVEETLGRLAEAAGFHLLSVLRYPGALEDALIAILEVAKSPAPPPAPVGASALFQAYRDGYSATRARVRTRLGRAAGPARDGVALFGIGHHAIMFVNAFGLASEIALAVDDDPAKIGFFPPGFAGSVVSSQALLQDERIRTCLFAVAPDVQAKLRTRLAPLRARGVKFRSIYAALEDSIVKDLA